MADTTKTVDQLNSFLRGELTAVETYRQAMSSLETSRVGSELADCKRSHEQRVELLTQQIRARGGIPSTSSGPWGTFATLVQSGATALGEKAAIEALEAGEDHGNADYKRDVDKLDAEARAFVESRVIPLQQRSHAQMSALKKQLH